MTATNIFSDFGGFRCSYPSLWYIPPLIYGRLRIYSWLGGGGGEGSCDMRQLFSVSAEFQECNLSHNKFG